VALSARTRRTLAVSLLTLLASLAIASPALTQAGDEDDARNRSKAESGRDTDCLSCHRSGGMSDSHVLQAAFPKSIVRGEPAPFRLRVDNPWRHDVVALRVAVLLPANETGLSPAGDAVADVARQQALPMLHGQLGRPDLAKSAPGSVPSHQSVATFDLGPNPSALHGRLELYPVGVEGAPTAPPKVTAEILPSGNRPAGNWTPSGTDALYRDVAVSGAQIREGTWKLRLTYLSDPNAALQPAKVAYAFVGNASYGGVQGRFELPAWTGRLAPGEGTEIPFVMRGVRDGTYAVEAEVRATVYYHHKTVGNYDWENYTRVRTAQVEVGSVHVGPDAVARLGPVAASDGKVVVAEVAGAASAILLPPAMLVGGTYGRSSRQFLNTLLGGAKRRVMFHSAVSLGLTGAAVAHAALFLLEGLYAVHVGLLWGGLGVVGLLGLALTGYYQVPLIQKYGYGWWRGVHLVMGIGVVLFTCVHALLDGSHFGDLKEELPAWLTRMNLG
jgi:hypothetical protein